ncbi:MAG: hypothetical protein ISS25_03515 [Nanoarchaeota archaeon]|nr:hypothetical protein [DPANN group archaeon]MBL7116870.1 hypothetical protein [Nanoarchaeota archaeon]
MTWGTYYLIKHSSKKEDPEFGQRQEHIHFKIHLDNQKTLTSYVLPQKKFDPKKKTNLIYMGRFDVDSALSYGKIIEKGIIDKIGPHQFTISDKFIISIYQPPKMKEQKSKMFFVSYKPLERPKRWWEKYKKIAELSKRG